jgi:hypothetical protein
METVGYEHVRSALGLLLPDVRRAARVMPVTRLIETPQVIQVPRSVAPSSDDPLDHILFALKHEGTNLPVLSEAMAAIDAEALRTELRRAPNGAYIRKACYLWELFTGGELNDIPPVGGAVVDLFDPARYFTGPARKNAKWRVSFNGIGTPGYCATIERTPRLVEALGRDTIRRTREFSESLPGALVDRALEWAYLHETQSSFAIERESPSEGRARRFMRLLQQAHDGAPLNEDYLIQLQQEAITNPHDQAVSIRHEQNWLADGHRGATGVTYLPPPPPLAETLLSELLNFTNDHAKAVDPLLMATVVSFGFVFIHPFMDGNGRLSRFLFHKALCMTGALPKGVLLPVSVAMARNERDYLDALRGYSKSTRDFWEVSWINDDTYAFDFQGSPSIYRFWDATRCAEFATDMADQALEVELKNETEFLARYDRMTAAINARFDVRNSTLSQLVTMCLSNGGVMSVRRRDQFKGQVPEAVFDEIERLATAELASQQTRKPNP